MEFSRLLDETILMYTCVNGSEFSWKVACDKIEISPLQTNKVTVMKPKLKKSMNEKT